MPTVTDTQQQDSHGENVSETQVRVRYAETDAMGVVHHSAYVPWLELARTEYMRERGKSYVDFERDGFALPVTELNIRYVAPCRYDDLVVVRSCVEEVRSRSIRFRYEIIGPRGELLLTASTGHICTTTAGRVTSIPSQIRALAANPKRPDDARAGQPVPLDGATAGATIGA